MELLLRVKALHLHLHPHHLLLKKAGKQLKKEKVRLDHEVRARVHVLS
jgi:hypothetical protein